MNAPARGSDDGLEEAKGGGGISEDRIPYAPEPPTDGGGGSGGQRRHERVTAPLDIIFQRKIYKALDWSMTGFALDPAAFDLPVGQRFRFHARFQMRGAQMAAEFQAEVTRRAAERIGCRFVETTPDQIQILRMLLAAYRSGRAQPWETMMGLDQGGPVRGTPRREGTASAGDGRAGSAVESEPSSGGPLLSWRPSPRVVYGVLILVALLVVGLVGVTRLSPDLDSTFAALSLPGGRDVTADRDGTVTDVLAAPGDLVGMRTVILRLTPANTETAAPVPILSPCVCTVRSLAVAPGALVEVGDPLVALGPVDGSGGEGGPVIEALFPLDDLEALSPGTAVQVRLAGLKSLLTGRVVEPDGSRSVLPDVLKERGGLGVVHVSLEAPPDGVYDGQPARVRLRRSLLARVGL